MGKAVLDKEVIDLIAGLTHELGVALEISFAPEEFLLLWPEAVDLLAQAKVCLTNNDRPIPGAVENILNATRAGMN